MNPVLAKWLATVLLCYTLGCLTPGYWWARWTGKGDLRHAGSGSVGARNAARVLGKRAGMMVFVLDAAKGAIAIALAHVLVLPPLWIITALIAVVSGHIWPAPLGFNGGKGMATALGAVAALDPPVLLLCLAAFGVLWLTSRHFMRSGLLSVSVLPCAACLLGRSPVMIWGYLALAALLLWAHRANIAASRIVES